MLLAHILEKEELQQKELGLRRPKMGRTSTPQSSFAEGDEDVKTKDGEM